MLIFNFLSQFLALKFFHGALIVSFFFVHLPQNMSFSQLFFLFKVLVKVSNRGFGDNLILPSIRIAYLEVIV